MKFSCSKSELASCLGFVSRGIPSRPLLAIMGNVYFSADLQGQTLLLKSFDGNLGMTAEFPATVLEEGEFTLPARLLNDIVSKMPDAEVKVELEKGTDQVSIVCGSARYRLMGMLADEFPEPPKLSERKHTTVLPVEVLLEGLRSTIFAVSTDDAKPILNGVNLIAEAPKMEFAATDGHRLAVLQTEISDGEEMPSVQVTIPARAMRELERMLDKQAEGAIAVQFDQTQIMFETAKQTLTSRLLDGNYPNYRQLLPKDFVYQVTVDRKAFLASLERVAVLADNLTHLVKLNIDSIKQEIVISAESGEANGQDSLTAQIAGGSIEIAFNEKYLSEGIKAMSTTEIQMRINSPISPVVFTPVGGSKLTYLIMPIQIRK
jgi:DNA polymerase-3 subunit beta